MLMKSKRIVLFIICFLMAVQLFPQSRKTDIEAVYSDYMRAKEFLGENLKESDKKTLYQIYVTNGCLWASHLMNQDTYDSFKQARDVLLEIAPYADEKLKEYVFPRIPLSWYCQGAICFESQKFDEALICFENALSGYRELKYYKDELSVLKQIAYVKYYLDNLEESIEKFEETLKLSMQYGDDATVMEVAAQLHKIYVMVGNMGKVDEYSYLMDSIMESSSDVLARFNYYVKRGDEAKKQDRPMVAEGWFIKAESLIENNESLSAGANKYVVYSNLRDLYLDNRNYGKAIEYAYKTLEDSDRFGGTSDRKFFLSFGSIADIYSRMGDKENCMRYLDSLFALKTNIEEPRELRLAYFYRGHCLSNLGEYDAALENYRKADDIMALKYPVSDGDRVNLYPLIGGLEHKLGNYKESEKYYRLYADQIKDIYGEYSVKYINAQVYCANAQGFAGNIKDGCCSYISALGQLKTIIKARLPYMNSTERNGLWTPISSLLTLMTPYALKAEMLQNQFTETAYNALLMSKSFLLDSERSLFDIVNREGDEDDKAAYMQIASLTKQIKGWERDYARFSDNILTASTQVNKLERKLIGKMKSFEEMTSFLDVDYAKVKDALKNNEFLVDFTDFIPDGKSRIYAAYLISQKQEFPLLKRVFEEQQIDSMGIVRPDMFYDKDFADGIIRLLWNPLKDHIAEGATVYYVPSQMLFNVCLESLPLGDGTLLGDHYHFIRLSSARELVRKRNNSNSKSAVLYGGLQYDLEPDVMAENAKQYDLSSLSVMRGRDIVRGDSLFKELPGSKVEIERISEILNSSKFNVIPYMGVDGTEESFLNLHGKSPKILHLATHGFYYTPLEANDVDYLRGYSDAMLLSGLIMSGGNAAWQGKELPKGVLGGVLTANNIARLDLSNTDMVVLSACQSGQGNATAEGLYGLQRAFKKAGVGTMVMTLWSVSDKVATEFMIKFYELLVENKWDKHKAFGHTKSYIRTLHPDPYHWAAFVMLD